MQTLATSSRIFPTLARQSRRYRSVARTHPRRNRSVLHAKAKSQRDADQKKEPLPQTPLEEAVEETLCDGRHVLVVLDRRGARLYRTQMSSATPSKLEPIIQYNHRGE
jgi:hypothetical protein